MCVGKEKGVYVNKTVQLYKCIENSVTRSGNQAKKYLTSKSAVALVHINMCHGLFFVLMIKKNIYFFILNIENLPASDAPKAQPRCLWLTGGKILWCCLPFCKLLMSWKDMSLIFKYVIFEMLLNSSNNMEDCFRMCLFTIFLKRHEPKSLWSPLSRSLLCL